MLHKNYNCKDSVEKNEISGRDRLRAWHQGELIGGTPLS
jgi:hypothetical protein